MAIIAFPPPFDVKWSFCNFKISNINLNFKKCFNVNFYMFLFIGYIILCTTQSASLRKMSGLEVWNIIKLINNSLAGLPGCHTSIFKLRFMVYVVSTSHIISPLEWVPNEWSLNFTVID